MSQIRKARKALQRLQTLRNKTEKRIAVLQRNLAEQDEFISLASTTLLNLDEINEQEEIDHAIYQPEQA